MTTTEELPRFIDQKKLQKTSKVLHVHNNYFGLWQAFIRWSGGGSKEEELEVKYNVDLSIHKL